MEESKEILESNEEPLFSFNTTYTEEVYSEFVDSQKKAFVKIVTIFGITGILVLAIGIGLGSFLIYFGAAIILIKTVKNLKNTKDNYISTRFYYDVFSSKIRYESVSARTESRTIIDLSQVIDVTETDNIFIVKLNINHIYIFEKRELKEIDKYHEFKRLLLNHSKIYNGMKINKKNDYEAYDYVSNKEARTSKKSSAKQVNARIFIIILVAFFAFLGATLWYQNGGGILAFKILLPILLISLILVIILSRKYKGLTWSTFSIVVLSIINVITGILILILSLY